MSDMNTPDPKSLVDADRRDFVRKAGAVAVSTLAAPYVWGQGRTDETLVVNSFAGPSIYLDTAYGPVTHGTVMGDLAQPAFYSIFGTLSTNGQIVSVASATAKVETEESTPDGVYALTCGYRALNSPYGPVIYGTQYLNGYGRWGNYNTLTKLFYPDGGWLPIYGS